MQFFGCGRAGYRFITADVGIAFDCAGTIGSGISLGFGITGNCQVLGDIRITGNIGISANRGIPIDRRGIGNV